MGYAVTPIAVDLREVKSIINSRDVSVIATLKSNFDFRFNGSDWDDDEELDQETAIRQLMNGTELNPDYGHLYAYGLELLCWHFGQHLSNRYWSAMDSEWAVQVDDALKSHGMDESIFGIHNHIFYRGAPIAIPEPDDFPSIGFLLNQEMHPAFAGLKALLLETVDTETLQSISEVQQWIETCIAKNCDLVTFYY